MAPNAAIYLVMVKGKVVNEIPADSRRDALRGWLLMHKYGSLIAAAAARDCKPDEISISEKP